MSNNICIARIWNKGNGARCSCKTKIGDFCGRHGRLNPHKTKCPDPNCKGYNTHHTYVWEHLGRYDEEIPTFFNKKARLMNESNESNKSNKSNESNESNKSYESNESNESNKCNKCNKSNKRLPPKIDEMVIDKIGERVKNLDIGVENVLEVLRQPPYKLLKNKRSEYWECRGSRENIGDIFPNYKENLSYISKQNIDEMDNVLTNLETMKQMDVDKKVGHIFDYFRDYINYILPSKIENIIRIQDTYKKAYLYDKLLKKCYQITDLELENPIGILENIQDTKIITIKCYNCF
jgi:hypothetical protein